MTESRKSSKAGSRREQSPGNHSDKTQGGQNDSNDNGEENDKNDAIDNRKENGRDGNDNNEKNENANKKNNNQQNSNNQQNGNNRKNDKNERENENADNDDNADSDKEDEEVNLQDAGDKDVTDAEQKRSKHKRLITRLFANGWGFEIANWIFSAIITLVIILLLKLYDNRPLSDWSGSLSVNTTVALLTTVAKLGFVTANTAALGQLRWMWYSQPHYLADLKTFDDASRGSPWGSFALLMKLHVRHLASIGAFVSLAAIFFSSLTQEAITFPSRTIVTGNASIGRGYSYVAETNQRFSISASGTNFLSATDSQLIAAVAFTAYYGMDQSLSSIALQADCSTGNCTFQPYASLAACCSCTPITYSVEETCNFERSCFYTLPLTSSNQTLTTGSHIVTIDGSPAYTTLNVTADITSNLPFAVANISALYTEYELAPGTLNNVTNGSTTAMSCSIFMCVKMFNSTVTNGTLTDIIMSTHPINASVFTKNANGTYTAPVSSATNLTSNATMEINQDSLNVFGQSLAQLYTGSVIVGPGTDNSGKTAYGYGYTSTTLQSLFNNNSLALPFAFNNVAIAITNVIRQQSPAAFRVIGRSFSLTTFLVVRWAWIAYPTGLVFIVFIFLMVTIIKTSKSNVQNVWKSSPIALLFHGLGDRGMGLQNVSRINKLSEMSELAGKIRVRLARQGSGTTLVDARSPVDEVDESD